MDSIPTQLDPPYETPPLDGRPLYSEDGVDLTLIRWMLSMTPAERLRVLQEHHRSIMKLRHGNRNL